MQYPKGNADKYNPTRLTNNPAHGKDLSKPFRSTLNKSEKKAFDEMWDIPKLYVMACSNSVSLVPFHPIAIPILFHHYKELMDCEKQINKLMGSNNNHQVDDDLKEYLENETDLGTEEDFQIEEEEEEQLTLFGF
jgi:hypothetical protein